MLSEENIQRLSDAIHQRLVANEALSAADFQLAGMQEMRSTALTKQVEATNTLNSLFQELDLGDRDGWTPPPTAVQGAS